MLATYIRLHDVVMTEAQISGIFMNHGCLRATVPPCMHLMLEYHNPFRAAILIIKPASIDTGTRSCITENIHAHEFS